MAEKINRKCTPQIIAYTFVRQKTTHVEKIARVLALAQDMVSEGAKDICRSMD